jgi:hypothetical protein
MRSGRRWARVGHTRRRRCGLGWRLSRTPTHGRHDEERDEQHPDDKGGNEPKMLRYPLMRCRMRCRWIGGGIRGWSFLRDHRSPAFRRLTAPGPPPSSTISNSQNHPRLGRPARSDPTATWPTTNLARPQETEHTGRSPGPRHRVRQSPPVGPLCCESPQLKWLRMSKDGHLSAAQGGAIPGA